MAIHKVHARGRGGGAGPVEYLLGRDGKREAATLLRGDPQQMIELIDSLKFAQKYTSGVISFAESDIPEQHKQEIMDGLERTLLPGLDADQYSVMWVEHRDKGRLELNYVFANVELHSGKRLAPYYDKADRKRVQAWMETVRHDYELADPNAPERRRALSTPADLPRDKKQAAEVITAGLMEQMKAGAIKNRADVVQALESAGFEVARQVKGSISIKDPSGGKNIRLQGAIYERDFKFSAELREEIARESYEYRKGATERVREARSTYQALLERKREYLAGRYFKEPSAPALGDSKGLDVATDKPLISLDSFGRANLVDGRGHQRQRSDHTQTARYQSSAGRLAGHENMDGQRENNLAVTQGLDSERSFHKRGQGGSAGRNQKSDGGITSDRRKEARQIPKNGARYHSGHDNGAQALPARARATEPRRGAGERITAYLHHLQSLQNRQALLRVGADCRQDRERVEHQGAVHSDQRQLLMRPAVQRTARLGSLDVRDVHADAGGVEHESVGNSKSIIERIGAVAARARRAAKAVAGRTRDAAASFVSAFRRFDGSFGQFDRAIEQRDSADAENLAAGARACAASAELGACTQQLEQSIDKALTPKEDRSEKGFGFDMSMSM